MVCCRPNPGGHVGLHGGLGAHQPGWQLDEYGDKFAGVLAGRVWVTDSYGWGGSYDPDEIRTAAHKLLAAADAAEKWVCHDPT